MLNLQEIENTIEELEQGATTFDTCLKLSALYIVRDHIKGTTTRQADENAHGHEVKPCNVHGIAVKDAFLVDHVVMAQREQLRYCLNGSVHGEYRKCEACGGEAEYGPQRTDTHGHSQRRHQSKGEHSKALCRQYGQKP